MSEQAVHPQEHIEIVDALRGLASIAVVWFHLTHETGLVMPDSWLDLSGSYGWVGTEVFFVISGFIVPYSMARSNYRLRDFARFISRRIVRLDPPYLTSIAALLLIAVWHWLGSGRTTFMYSPVQILLHLGYLNAFVGYPWIDPVYWMLAVEFQFCLLAGLAFPLILKRNIFWLVVAPLCIVGTFTIHQHDYVFQYLPFFLLGVAALHYRRKMIGAPAFLLLILLLAVCARFRMGGAPAAAGFFSALATGTVNFAPRPLVALGTISYSLYLVHGPVLQFLKMFIPNPATNAGRVEWAFLNLIGGLAAAWILHKAVELPSQRLSRQIRYKVDG